MRFRVAALLLAVATLFPACGGGASEAETRRRQQVAEIRAAAERGDTGAARWAVAELQALVDEQRVAGDIDVGEAARVLAAAKGVERALGPPPAETTTTTAPPPPAPAAEPAGDDDDDDGGGGGGERGRGNGDRGREKGDDD